MITITGNKFINSYLAVLDYLHKTARSKRMLIEILHFRVPEAYNSIIRMN